MSRYLFVTWVLTCIQCFHSSFPLTAPPQVLPANDHQTVSDIQDLPDDVGIKPGSNSGSVGSSGDSEQFELSFQDFLPSRRTESFASPALSKGDLSENGDNLDEESDIQNNSFLSEKSRDWRGIRKHMLDTSKISGTFIRHTPNGISRAREFARKSRGRLGRMPAMFGKRSPLLIMNSRRFLENGPNHEDVEGMPTREQLDDSSNKAVHFREPQFGKLAGTLFLFEKMASRIDSVRAQNSNSEEDEDSQETDPILGSKYLARETRGRLQRMPYAFGKRFIGEPNKRLAWNRANERELSSLMIGPSKETHGHRIRKLPFHIVSRLSQKMVDLPTNDASISNMGSDLPEIREQRSRLGRMPLTFGKRALTELWGKSTVKSSYSSPLNINSRYPLLQRRVYINRRPFGFEKNFHYGEKPRLHMKKRGSLRRMPLSFGKRESSDFDISSHLAQWTPSVYGHSGFLSHKRSSLRRMPLSFGKRSKRASTAKEEIERQNEYK